MQKLHKVVITGPTGAVGMSLIFHLIDQNVQVTVICRPNSKRLNIIPKHPLVSVVECDVSNLESLIGKMSNDYDAFFHFAWIGPFGPERQDLILQTMNVRYSIEAVRLASNLGCEVFIGAGSQSEFGHVDGVLHPYLPCNPDNGYGIAKLMAGQMSRVECHKLGLRHEWARIVSMYGKYDGDYTMVLSSIQKMLKGERPQFTKAEQTWDYIYNEDAALAFRLIAEKGKEDSIYLLGSGKSRMLKDYIYAIRDAVNPTMDIGIGELDYYPNQVMHLEADISNLTEDTGFVPKYSFEEGIKETVEWARDILCKK